LHVGDARGDLRVWEVIAEAEHRSQPSRHHSSQLPSNYLISLGMVASTFRVTDEHGRGDSNEMISGDLARERSRTVE